MTKSFLLVKVSGDLVGNRQVEEETEGLSRDHFVVLVHGGGKQFSDTLEKEGIEYYFYEGNRVVDQKALRLCYEGPQREIADYYHSRFREDTGCSVCLISPITESNGELLNINADVMFSKLYESGVFEKGIIYARQDHDKSHLRKEGVEIRYV